MKPIAIIYAILLPILLSAENKKFYNASDIYGVSVTEPNSVCKDHNGFIWVASKEGVLRLDDNGGKIYRLPYSSMNVMSVEVIHSGNHLIAFTNQGEIFTYNPLLDRFELKLNLLEKLNLDNIYLSQVMPDINGNLWLAGSNGLSVWDGISVSNIKDIAGAVGDMIAYDDSTLLIGGYDGIFSIDTPSMRPERICDIGSVFPTRLVTDHETGRIWVGTMSDGLFYIDTAQRSIHAIEAAEFPRQYVRDIEIVTDSTIWCGIDGRGIYELSRDGKRVLQTYRENPDDPYAISGNGIQDMYYENPGRVFVCSYTGGVNITDMRHERATLYTHRTGSYNSLVNNYIYDIDEDKLGQLWVATNSGLSCWDTATGNWTNLFDDKWRESFIVPSVCCDNDDNVWIGTYSHGVYVIDIHTKRIKAHHTMNDGILSKNGFVFDIMCDGNGYIWLTGMIGDILRYDHSSGEFEHYPQVPATALTNLDDSSVLLLSSNRLLALDKKTKKYDTLLSDHIIKDMAVSHGNIWIATAGDGLLSLDLSTHKVSAYGIREGFPSDHISSIVNHGENLWIASDKGIYLFDITNRKVTEHLLQPSSPNVAFTASAALSLKSGHTAWGTSRGLLIVSNESASDTHDSVRIYLDDILLSGQSIRTIEGLSPIIPLDEISSITLDYNHNNISFGMLTIGASHSPRFSYMLKGVDDTWNSSDHISSINYNNVAPGDYQLIIRVQTPGSTSERHIDIHITPPFWKRWWFNLLCLCMIAGIFLFFIRTYINRLNRQNAESKLQFFVTTAHDLRTALTLIKAPIQQLHDSGHLSEAERNCLHLASENVNHLTSLTTKLMDFQKIDTGKIQPFFTMLDIIPFIRTRISMFTSCAEQKNITIRFTASHDSYTTAVDVNKMEQIVDNLISNAIKYSNEDSFVDISVICNDRSWSLTVADQGIGISKKDMKKLFREFYRGQNAINSKIIGSGIGLALVKRLVEIHNGTITVESRVNVGSEFKIAIPYCSVSSPMDETVCYSETITDSTDEAAISEDMNILFVEDNDDLRRFMADTLGKQFKITAVSDGAQAWSIIQEKIPDIIVSDIMMPNLDGFELCRLVKSTFETSHIPVVLLSALTDRADELRGLGLGADDYMTKPFDVKTLSKRIATIIRNRRNLMSRMLTRYDTPAASISEPINRLNDTFVKTAIDTIMLHLDNSEFGKEEFAKAMGVSTSLLFKKIKALTGLSIVDFIKKVRMEHALTLLNDQSLSIGDVAFQCGFSSIGYFSTVFKKHFGKTPSEIRKP